MRRNLKFISAIALAVALGFGGSIAASPVQPAFGAPVEDDSVIIEPSDPEEDAAPDTEVPEPVETEAPEPTTAPTPEPEPEPTETGTPEPTPHPTPKPSETEAPVPSPEEPVHPEPEPPAPEPGDGDDGGTETQTPGDVVVEIAKMRVSQTESAAGLSYEGRGFGAGAVRIELVDDGGTVVEVAPDAPSNDGGFHGTLVYRSADGAAQPMPVGTHTLRVTQDTGEGVTILAETRFEVMPEAAGPGSGGSSADASFAADDHEGGLAHTGADNSIWFAIGIGAVLVAGGASMLLRHRRTGLRSR